MSSQYSMKSMQNLASLLNIKLTYRGKRRNKLSLYNAIKRVSKRDGRDHLNTLKTRSRFNKAAIEGSYRQKYPTKYRSQIRDDMDYRDEEEYILPNTSAGRKKWASNPRKYDLEGFDDGEHAKPMRTKKRAPSAYNLFMKKYMASHKKRGRSRAEHVKVFKAGAAAWKASKKKTTIIKNKSGQTWQQFRKKYVADHVGESSPKQLNTRAAAAWRLKKTKPVKRIKSFINKPLAFETANEFVKHAILVEKLNLGRTHTKSELVKRKRMYKMLWNQAKETPFLFR